MVIPSLRRLVRALAALAAASALLPASAAAASGDVLVRFAPGTDARDREKARDAARSDFERRLPVRGLQQVDPEPGVTAGQAIVALERSPDVLYAEADVIRRAAVLPNDEFFELQWSLPKIAAPAAWSLTTGGEAAKVAVVDSGVDLDHPDLEPNLLAGHDFVSGDSVAQDGNGHGTHVAGTIGARGNDSTGVAGVAWQAGLVPVRVLGDDGEGSVSNVIAGYGWARDHGARVVNASLGGSFFSQAERDAIAASPDVLFVVAAGNGGDDGVGDDNDSIETGSYPCEHSLPNLICVASTGKSDALSSFSNYGDETVHLAAPGEDVASAWIDDWAYASGTSMATPHVAGAAALMLARNPGATVAQLRGALLDQTDPVPALEGKLATGGRLNAHHALAAVPAATSSTVSEPPPAASTAPPSSPARTAAPRVVDLLAPAPRVSLRRGLRLRAALKRGIRVRVRCDEACSLAARVVARRRAVGKGARRRGSGSRIVTVRLSRKGKRRLRRLLRRARRVKVTLVIGAADAAGNSRRLQRRLTLRR